MSAAGLSEYLLSPHELHLCGDLLGVEQLPVVLGAGPQSPDVDTWAAAMAAAREDLTGRGLLDGAGHLSDELEDLLHVLGNPTREIAARRVGKGGLRRLCVAADRRGDNVRASRDPGEDSPVTLARSESDVESLRCLLGDRKPLAAASGNASLPALLEGLAAAEGFPACAQALEAAGVGGTQSSVIAEVLTTATAFTEIVTIRHESGQASATPAAMVVYDAPAGRLVATPRRAPDGALWVSFGPGGWDRVARGLRALDELAASDGVEAVMGA